MFNAVMKRSYKSDTENLTRCQFSQKAVHDDLVSWEVSLNIFFFVYTIYFYFQNFKNHANYTNHTYQ